MTLRNSRLTYFFSGGKGSVVVFSFVAPIDDYSVFRSL